MTFLFKDLLEIIANTNSMNANPCPALMEEYVQIALMTIFVHVEEDLLEKDAK